MNKAVLAGIGASLIIAGCRPNTPEPLRALPESNEISASPEPSLETIPETFPLSSTIPRIGSSSLDLLPYQDGHPVDIYKINSNLYIFWFRDNSLAWEDNPNAKGILVDINPGLEFERTLHPRNHKDSVVFYPCNEAIDDYGYQCFSIGEINGEKFKIDMRIDPTGQNPISYSLEMEDIAFFDMKIQSITEVDVATIPTANNLTHIEINYADGIEQCSVVETHGIERKIVVLGNRNYSMENDSRVIEIQSSNVFSYFEVKSDGSIERMHHLPDLSSRFNQLDLDIEKLNEQRNTSTSVNDIDLRLFTNSSLDDSEVKLKLKYDYDYDILFNFLDKIQSYYNLDLSNKLGQLKELSFNISSKYIDREGAFAYYLGVTFTNPNGVPQSLFLEIDIKSLEETPKESKYCGIGE